MSFTMLALGKIRVLMFSLKLRDGDVDISLQGIDAHSPSVKNELSDQAQSLYTNRRIYRWKRVSDCSFV